MIELHISAGYSWSVWKTEGGLQPPVESLPIPPEFGAPLKEWTFRKIPGIHAPTFTRRKEFDEEGRLLAAELQRAVGDRLHVRFKHWVSFDPKHWRTLWCEEDLFSGEQKEFWLEEDLPAEVITKVVLIFPDLCCSYLWDLDGCGIGNESPVFSDALDGRFTEWAKKWDAHYDIDAIKLDRAALSAEGFDDQGLALAAELKREIGKTARVIYFCTLRKAAVEVLKDGRTIEWPRETDFRQWALDHAPRT